MFNALTAWLQRGSRNEASVAGAPSALAFGPQTYFSGMLRCHNSIVLEGHVENSRIETDANIIITESARVTCNLSARIVSVRGQYTGTLVADRAEVLAGAQVNGHVHVNSIYIHEQATMNAEMFLLDAERRGLAEGPEEITTDVITRTSQHLLRPSPEIGT